jgi:hypothetical protein
MIVYEVQLKTENEELIKRWLFQYPDDATKWAKKHNTSRDAKISKNKCVVLAIKLNVNTNKPIEVI